MRRRLAALALAAAATVACGGDGADGADGAGDVVGGDGPTATVAAGDQTFCDAFGAIIGGPLTDEGNDFRDPAVLQSAVELTQDLLAVTVDGAPADLVSAATQFAQEYQGGFEIWARYGYDLDRVDTEATAEEQAVLDAFLAPPQGPGGADPLAVLEEGYFSRCTAGVTLPPGVLDSTTTTTSP